MSNYFIHTFELSKNISYSEYMKLKEKLKCMPDRNIIDEALYVKKCTAYKDKGLIISFRSCNENEKKGCTAEESHKLIIQVNPSRVVARGTYKNEIENVGHFEYMMDLLNMDLENIFSDVLDDIQGVNDFKLRRIDITKDIREVPENVIQQFILLMRRLPLYYGYKMNEKLEKNCEGFRHEDSYNVVNESRGLEFVLYNKHRATIDQNYPEEMQEYYKGTLRMELRCERKYVRDKIEKKCNSDKTEDILMYAYKNRAEFVWDIYMSMYKGYTGCCYVPYHRAKKIIKRTQGTKEKHAEKMLKLLYECKNSDVTIDESVATIFKSETARENIKEQFESIELLPATSNEIPFIQSSDSLLGFAGVSERERKYYEFTMKKYANEKEIFILW